MGYQRMTFRRALELAAPQTWPASILPVCLGTLLAVHDGGAFRPVVSLAVLAAAVLLQSAVNTFNDVRDFMRGTDAPDNCTDETDAAMLFGHLHPKAGLALGFGFLFFAALCGIALGIICSWRIWFFGLAAAAAIAAYSLGAADIPAGELLSGLSMGGILPLAAYFAQCGSCSWPLVWRFAPAVITIACIMLTNNTADIGRDTATGRRTLAVRIGQAWALALLNVLLLAAFFGVSAIVLGSAFNGWPVLPVAAAGAVLAARPLFLSSVGPDTRTQAMTAVVRTHVWIIGGYTAALAVNCL